MTELLLVVLIAVLEYMSSGFAASIPSPLLLPLHQSLNSTVAFNASLAAASNSSLIPSLKFVFPILRFRPPEQLIDPSKVIYHQIPGKRSKIAIKDYD